jgi:hypothetical protein
VGARATPAPIEVINANRWGTFEGNYFGRIKVADLLLCYKVVPHPKNNASSMGVNDAASFLLFFASGFSIGASHTCDDMQRVLETPLE